MRAVRRAGSSLFGLVIVLAVAAAFTAPAPAAPGHGKVQGKVLTADTGEPLSAADVVLLPVDSTMKRVGGFTNNDGTFLLEAAPGVYTLQVRALSYRAKRVTGLAVRAGEMLPITVTVETEAITQKEVVVEATRAQNTEKSMMIQRQKATTVGDAVSAEAVRKSPDRDAAEVLRRVTGLSVSDGKYVYVRGMGERYSSTQIDGVRLVSPEPNKRVVPLDIVPANLLENVVVQKTHSADRPGEFGGGDVQLKTRDFPGQRTMSFSASLGGTEGTTFQDIGSYPGGSGDLLAWGAHDRGMPETVVETANGKQIILQGLDRSRGFPQAVLADMGRSFDNVWTPGTDRAAPNSSFSESFGDEWRPFGRPLGFIQSLSYSRNLNQTQEYRGKPDVAGGYEKEYQNVESTESIQWGGLGALAYRLTPRHSLHARTVFTRSADDETRVANYLDNNRELEHIKRSYRLRYTERVTLNGLVEGRHELPALGGSRFDWKLTASRANREEPDRREANYYFQPEFYDSDREVTVPERWLLLTGRNTTRLYEEQRDKGRGLDGTFEVPLRNVLGMKGRVTAGAAYENKDRDAAMRRLHFRPANSGSVDAPPESLFDDPDWNSQMPSATIEEFTYVDDNYTAEQRVAAGFVGLDLTVAPRLRAVLGLRVEHGVQEVRNFELFAPSVTTAEASLDDVDWLPSANLVWSVADDANLRLAASRTLSRPDLRELSKTREYDLDGYYPRFGNPDLERAVIENWDLRYETFPNAAEVIAFGAFYKRLYRPIEDALRPADEPFLQPYNAERGSNFGFEVEARAGLARWHRRLSGLFVSTNFSIINSNVTLRQDTGNLGNPEHPLQGQANFVFNGTVSWATRDARTDFALLVNSVGRRLSLVAFSNAPDYYDQPFTTVDAVMNWKATPGIRLKFSGKNLLDAEQTEKEGDVVTRRLSVGRSYTVGLAWGS